MLDYRPTVGDVGGDWQATEPGKERRDRWLATLQREAKHAPGASREELIDLESPVEPEGVRNGFHRRMLPEPRGQL